MLNETKIIEFIKELEKRDIYLYKLESWWNIYILDNFEISDILKSILIK